MRRTKDVSIIIALFIAVLCLGCGKAERHAENKIAKALQERLGPAESYEVNITGSPMKLLKGKMERLDIVGKNVNLEKGVKLASLNVTVHDLVFNTKTQEIMYASKTSFSAAIAQDELTKYLHKNYPDVPELKIALRTGYIDVSAKPTVAGVGVAVKTEADIHVKDHHLLILDLKKISAAGVPVPEFARNYIETKVNPVFDSKDLGFNATVNSIRMAQGSICVAGNLDLVQAVQLNK
ncbi:DUF2993 domain-containing protein [bacterium]|nr:DUF2993 domain-containing protein [bacterium]